MLRTALTIAIGLLAISGTTNATEKCRSVDRRFEVTGPSISLAEMERIGLEKARSRPAAPQVPWAYGHKDWLTFRSTFRPEDRILPYSQTFLLGERPYQWGYALFRGKCLLLVFPVRTA
jgi:hypothetical protein